MDEAEKAEALQQALRMIQDWVANAHEHLKWIQREWPASVTSGLNIQQLTAQADVLATGIEDAERKAKERAN